MAFPYAALGREIKRLRKEKGLSQEVLSGLAGIARTHLTMIENGSLKATTDTYYKIAQALGVKLSDVLTAIGE